MAVLTSKIVVMEEMHVYPPDKSKILSARHHLLGLVALGRPGLWTFTPQSAMLLSNAFLLFLDRNVCIVQHVSYS